MSKTVERPMYEELADTPWITRNRELNDYSYNNMLNALDNLNRFTDRDLNQYQTVADQYTQSMWNDLNRGYQQAVNNNIAREQNRLGTTGASSSLYNTNTLQNNYNDQAARLASQTASQYQNLINNEYNRRLSNTNLYNSLFNASGNITQSNDIANWQIRNTNKDRQWLNDVDKNNNTGWNWFANVNKGALEGFSEGMKTGNPWVGLGGAIAGSVGASGTNQNTGNSSANSNNSLFSNIGSLGNQLSNWWNTRNVNGTDYNSFMNNNNYLGSSGIGNYGLSTSDLQDILPNGGRFSWQ